MNVLRVPRIEFPNYPSYERLRTMSKDELMSAFCESPSEWGERQFTYCLGFAESPWADLLLRLLPSPPPLVASDSEDEANDDNDDDDASDDDDGDASSTDEMST